MRPEIDPMDLALLSQCSLFAAIAPSALAPFLQAGRRQRLEAKDSAITRGDPGRNIYFLLDGGVKVSTLSRDGKEIIFDVLVSGDFFGEMSLFDDKPRTGTVTALVPTTVFALGKAEFLTLIEKHPPVSLRLIRTLVRRLRLMDAFIEDVLFLDAEERLARRVLALSRLFGRHGDNGEIRIELKVSQQELANLVGVTRESVNKQFRDWEKSWLIAIDKGCLVLAKPGHLESMAARPS